MATGCFGGFIAKPAGQRGHSRPGGHRDRRTSKVGQRPKRPQQARGQRGHSRPEAKEATAGQRPQQARGQRGHSRPQKAIHCRRSCVASAELRKIHPATHLHPSRVSPSIHPVCSSPSHPSRAHPKRNPPATHPEFTHQSIHPSNHYIHTTRVNPESIHPCIHPSRVHPKFPHPCIHPSRVHAFFPYIHPSNHRFAIPPAVFVHPCLHPWIVAHA